MGLYDDVIVTTQQQSYSKIKRELMDKLDNLTIQCGIELTEVSSEFKDPDFLTNFFELIPEEDQKKYLITAYNRDCGKEYDFNNLLAFRRAIYTDYAKNESFWSIDFREPRYGLQEEQPLNSPVRLYSSIMVTTVGKLMDHGLAQNLEHGGASDGEIVIDASKPFSDFLFVYKPAEEIEPLKEYIESGGISLEELLAKLKETAEERMAAQGFRQ